MSRAGDQILEGLQAVARERIARRDDPALAASVSAVKHYQHARFGQSYADLMAQPRYARAAEFFLTDLYGPADFTDRDAQFTRIVPALVRLFPERIVDTVSDLSALHALSERLDSSMARLRLGSAHETGRDPGPDTQPMTGAEYGDLWRAVGEPGARERQIGLMVSVGEALDRYTRSALLRQSLRLMRGPAQAAGLGVLQAFLERGFETFRDMGGAGHFLETIATRERSLAAALFAGAGGPELSSRSP